MRADVLRPGRVAATAATWQLSNVALADYLRLIKFRYHITFLNVVFGALIFARDISPMLGVRLAVLYLSFNVLFYGGIYTMNDLADRREDLQHPGKRHRPIAAGRISPWGAALFSVAGIGLGLWTGVVWFGPQILGCFLVMLVINLAYSSGGRNLRYVDLLLNSLPHVVRLSMGALLVGRTAPIGHLASFLCLAIAMSCLRRDVEREATGVTGRSTLERYGPRELDAIVVTCLAMLVTLGVTVGETAPGFYVVLFSSAFVLLGGGYFVPAIRSVLAAVWVR